MGRSTVTGRCDKAWDWEIRTLHGCDFERSGESLLFVLADQERTAELLRSE